MAKKTVWYLGKEDRKEIESYSKEVSKLFKIKGFNLSSYDSDDCLDVEEFNFIPCIKEGLQSTEDTDELENIKKSIIANLIDSYDPTVKVTLKDLKAIEKNEGLIREMLTDKLDKSDDVCIEDLVNFIFSCGNDDVKEKFVNWAFDAVNRKQFLRARARFLI